MEPSPKPKTDITPQMLLRAYTLGIFPMAESADDHALFWVEPELRGVLPLGNMRVPQRLARTIRQGKFEIRVDTDFEAVISGCASPKPGRDETWINEPIRELYGELFRMGRCHTVETWQGGRLVGGLYGVHVNRAFFGESMFSTERDASKVALVYLVGRLIYGGFTLLDTQFITGHLQQFGAVEIPRPEFLKQLDHALEGDVANFHALPHDHPADSVLKIVSEARTPEA